MDRKPNRSGRDLIFDVDSLMNPSQVFERPSDVVNDPDLSLNEKRALLASWASDACAVEAAPALRKGPAGRVVQFDEIMDALRTLDKQVQALAGASKVVRRRLPAVNSRNDRGDKGTALH